MNMKRLTSKQISYIVIACLVLILSAQAYLVYDYYVTTKAGLVRESEAIMDEVFKKDLNRRNKIFDRLMKNDSITVVAPPQTRQNTFKADMSHAKELKGNALGTIELAIHCIVSQKVPLDITRVDSVAGEVLKSHNINSNYYLKIVDPESMKVIAQSKNIASSSVFSIASKYLIYDYANRLSVQIVLVNPFGVILRRMGVMLFASLAFSIICLIAFRWLQQILSRQKQLVVFKNEFLSTIAHELKRPVASLSFNLDCLSMPAFAQDAVKHNLLVTRSVNATEELNNTINMIVSLAKLEEGLLKLNKGPVDLSKLFIDLKTRFMNYPVKNIEIKTDFAPQAITVSADEQLLTQCFANLIDNSIKYSGKDVMIVIEVQRSGKWIVISIKDNGFGIPKEKLPVIFDKYTRLEPDNAKINGFGIGLNYVKTIVEKHEGEVAVRSYPGEGTKFSILLPDA